MSTTTSSNLPYLDKESLDKVVSAVDEDDTDSIRDNESVMRSVDDEAELKGDEELDEDILDSDGGPFSAIVHSMRPCGSSARSRMDECDEFGFRVDEEDGPEDARSSGGQRHNFCVEKESTKKLKWLAHLEFGSNNGPSKSSSSAFHSRLDFEAIVDKFERSDELRCMVMEGIPHALRPHLWPRLAGAKAKCEECEMSYKQMVRASSNDQLMTSRQIEKDLLRTLPNNVCFRSNASTGVPRLRRLLRALAWLYPEIGYCQGMGMIASLLLLVLEEETAFWTMSAIVEELLPPSYFSPNLIGVQADQLVFRGLLAQTMPNIDALLQEHDIELSLITLNWFLTLYSSVLNIRVLLRIWDLLLYDGSRVLFQLGLALIKLNESRILDAEANAAAIFSMVATVPAVVNDIDQVRFNENHFKLLESMATFSSVTTPPIVEDNRRRQVALLVADQTFRSANGNLSRCKRRNLTKSRSAIDLVLFPAATGIVVGNRREREEAARAKNVRQTQIILDLKEAIANIAAYFQAADPASYGSVSLIADYSAAGHSLDATNFLSISRSKRRRARALVDFERRDADELGFRRHDILTILSQRDEHCWVGELRGSVGWFPAKLVELLDERSKPYSAAGDDAVTPAPADLARGNLALAVKRVLEHGLRRNDAAIVGGGRAHPWAFVEAAANKEVEKDFNAVLSRLVLCKTFRLNEDGKVLSPEELLFRCVEAVNFTHGPEGAQMDVRLRSLICYGLNEQVLHLWLEVLASNEQLVAKWYHPWSFISSPGWVQIKCELRLLAQFAFKLNPEWELKNFKRDEHKPIQEGVQDMLVKHHLFSWDL